MTQQPPIAEGLGDMSQSLGDAQIKHMTERFLSWKLPANFSPDNGITAKRPNYAPNVRWEPAGTNLFDYTQAEAMVRHMVDGLPVSARRDHPLRDTPEHHAPLTREEKLAAFVVYCRALESAGLSPGFGRIKQDDERGIDFAFGLPNFMLRNALLTAPETVAEAAQMFAEKAASADTHPEDGDDFSAPLVSGAVPKADAQGPSHD